MKIKAFALTVIISIISSNFGYAATNWTGLSAVDTTNWSAGVPTISQVANLVYPAGDSQDIIISSNTSVLGLIYGANLT